MAQVKCLRLFIDMKNTSNQVLKELKEEVDKTLLFFVEMDLKVYGTVSDTTKEAFVKQGVKFPQELDINKKRI